VPAASLHTAISGHRLRDDAHRCRQHVTPSVTVAYATACAAVNGHRQVVAPTVMYAAIALSPRCFVMNDHRPSRWCTPPAATAACHHICDAHRHQQPLPSSCNTTGDRRRNDTAHHRQQQPPACAVSCFRLPSPLR
jgi:hypothetical protein